MMVKINISLLLAVHQQTLVKEFTKTMNSIYSQNYIPNDIIVIQDGPIQQELLNQILNFKNKKKINSHFIIKKNSGLAIALNQGIKICKNDLIARLDPEDEVINDRFYHQHQFMIRNPSVSVCGSFVKEIFNKKEKIIKKPINNSQITKYIKFRNPIIHSSVIFRKNRIINIGGYPIIDKCQDLFLWIKCLQSGLVLHNLPNIFLKTYLNQETMKRRNLAYFKNELSIYNYQYNQKLISKRIFIFNCFIRFILRSMPLFLKINTYKLFR